MPERTIKFNNSLLHPCHWLSWLGLSVAAILSLMPQPFRHGLGNLLGRYLYKNNHKRRDVVEKNLRQVFPKIGESELQSKVKESLGWYGKALFDYSLLFFGRRSRLNDLVTVRGVEHLKSLKDQERPIILFLAHSVMLEFAVIALSKAGYRSFGSYKASSNPVLDYIIAKSRCRFTDFVVSREEGLRPLIRGIKSGRIMIFLPDEDLGLDSAVFAPFFNRSKATLTTPSRLTRLGAASAIAGFVEFDEATKQYCLNLQPMPDNYPSNDAAIDATYLNEVLETLIQQSPTQYMWTMKCFKTTSDADRPFY